MNRITSKVRILDWLTCLALVWGIAQPVSALPASLSLATAPLADSTTTSVLPNLMFILDSSGSMDWNYLPDWVDDSICKNTTGAYNRACLNSPLFQSPDVNGVYYNPEIRYVPPVYSDGTSYPSQTAWTSVKDDGYNVQSTKSTDLVSNYVDVEWCTDTSYNDCLRNDNYLLPNTAAKLIDGKVYNVQHVTTSSGSRKVVSGSEDAPQLATRQVGPHYYRIIPGEYCDSPKLVNCQRAQDATYRYPARVRWCTDATNAAKVTPDAGTCQALRTGAYKTIRFPTRYSVAAQPAYPEVPASATFNFSMSSKCGSFNKAGIAAIVVGGVNILSSATSNYSSASDLANAVRAKSAGYGYTFGGSGGTLVVTAPLSAGNTTAIITLSRTSNSSSSCMYSPTSASLGGYQAATPEMAAGTGSFVRTDIVSGGTYPKAAGRSDCAGTSCTYDEEMTNFANWWTYYQTRMQTMKTAATLAFKPIDSRYRVGFIDIQGNNYVPVARFDSGSGNAKDKWYKKLVSINPANGTPLRSALSRVGKLFAGLKPVGTADPVQYSCQQNFTLLTTDGYWNTDSNSSITGLTGVQIPDMDGGTTPRPLYEGPTASSSTLADVAKYYYDTDLRTSALNNCTGADGLDVCDNNVFSSGTDNNRRQHMTTFTLGLGVDGTLLYTSDYKTATSGDFYDLTNGTGSTVVNWPVPVADTETAVDDLWHAAVNGQGTYFSAKDPTQLANGLNGALNAIGAKLGAGSAAATSSLNPVPGDNYAYVASYTTVKWQGNLEARTINLTTGDVSESPSWCVEDTVSASCPSPGEITSTVADGTTTYFCSTPNATAATCAGTLDATGTCNVEVPKACSGTLRSRVSATSDTRVIKMSDGNGGLVDFVYSNLSAAQKAYFSGTDLSQWPALSADQKTLAAGANLLAYLRGQNGYEDQTSNDALLRVYRYREATLGDITESQPEYVGKPKFKYTDAGYSAFVAAQTSRDRTVYVGANDGMLHAFNADDGTERWAFVPTPVIPNMSKLADKNYATLHTNYANGRPIIADVYDSTNSLWRTILVAGLDGGGRGYYALDISNPSSPTLLWEIDSSVEANLGYSYGYPIVTKNSSGKWVVLLTSGYNNTSPGDGKGYLFIRDALTGAAISTIGTGEGDATTPSGLARIANYGDDPMRDNTSVATYGGDLFGNVWRFDINAGTATKFAILTDSAGTVQPVTAAPELGTAYGHRIIFVGTGKYLEKADLVDTQRQTLYAIKDMGDSTTLTDLRSKLKTQTLTTSADGATRTASSNPVDLRTDLGWYVDFPDSGERAHVDPMLDSGLLLVPTTVPSNTVCSPGGYGWLNYFSYLTGTTDDGLVSQRYNAPIVGVNVYYTPDGQRHVSVVTSDNPTPKQPDKKLPNTGSQLNFQAKRVMWRELIP